ncbi:MAG TPA: PHP domain-containing protein, partial [Bacteroidia bacterium]|nr:PHP domain-containing protein [Bacteroidia bacterium]
MIRKSKSGGVIFERFCGFEKKFHTSSILELISCYSFLRGVPRPKDLVDAAKKAGLSHLALTDRNGMHGLPSFVEACRKVEISPITGVEFADDSGRLVL